MVLSQTYVLQVCFQVFQRITNAQYRPCISLPKCERLQTRQPLAPKMEVVGSTLRYQHSTTAERVHHGATRLRKYYFLMMSSISNPAKRSRPIGFGRCAGFWNIELRCKTHSFAMVCYHYACSMIVRSIISRTGSESWQLRFLQSDNLEK